MVLRAVLENSIMQKGLPATAGSKMLESFVSPFDATAVRRLVDAGVEIVGRAAMEEFGFVLTDTVKVCEAVDFVDDGRADFALCNDYTGAISHVAAERGLYYIHPTYGTISRYGLIPCVSSMDQIGVVCREPEVGFRALGIIAGFDSKDGAMLSRVEHGTAGDRELKDGDWIASCARNDGGRRKLRVESGELNQWRVDSGKLKVGEGCVDGELKYSELYVPVMQILCCAELANNISRYDGIKFGHRAKEYSGLGELYKKSRSEVFGADVKLATILGAMVLSQENYARYYDKAMRLRRLIRDSLEFDKYDVIVTDCPILSRLCGLPSLAAPGKVYIADVGREDVLQAVCKGIAGDGSCSKATAGDGGAV